jgi:YD repeat-containing protein
VNDNSGASNAQSALATMTITVTAVNDLPVVKITSPANGTFYTGTGTITFSATAYDVDNGDADRGQVQYSGIPASWSNGLSVQFYVNGAAVGAPLSQAPFTMTWQAPSTGSFTITANSFTRPNDDDEVKSPPVYIALTRPQAGHQITFSYDYTTHLSTGELIAVTESGPNAGRMPVCFTYDDQGQVTSITGLAPGSATSTGVTNLTYDSFGNVLTITSPGNNATQTMVTTFAYNPTDENSVSR